MSNKVKIIFVVSLIVFIVLAALGRFYWVKKEKQSFSREKETCQNRFTNTKSEDLLAADRFQATSLISCQAVKKKDANECNLLKDNKRAFENCQDMAKTYLKFVYPIFEKKDCLADSLNPDEKNICSGLILGNAGDCEKVSESSAGKAICLAVAQDKISVCDQVQDSEEKNGCRDFYYFAKAAKEGDLSYLDRVSSGTGFAIYKLFFNRDLSCTDLLKSSNEKYCDVVFSEEAWSKRILRRD
jgi:hypothetical protein